MTKRGQIHISETVAVLFIFFILVVFGIVFYARFQQTSLQHKENEFLATKAIETTTKVLFLPELACTKSGAETEDNCFDLAKLRHVNNLFTQERLYYFSLLSYATITVQQVYPPGGEPFVIYNEKKIAVPGDGTPSPTVNKEPTYFVVVLRDDLTENSVPRYYFGILTVEVYS
ncbi:TPA: hypothetical protein HA241_05275 [Candidatus Woesearchaeota archaeon]|nr:hypothetical protein [Candidatus Woesearchaeota archaeon]